MAANVKHKDSMDEVYSSFTSLYEELVKRYDACIRQRRRIEGNVQLCRKLLKPWPSPDKNKQETTNSSGVAADRNMTYSNENDGRLDGDKVEQGSPESNADIELLDKIIAKAQKAREIQEKIDAANLKAKIPRKLHSAQKPPTIKEKTLPKPTARKENVTNITNKPQRNPKTVAMVTKSKPTSQLSSTRPVIKQPVLERKKKTVSMKTTYGESFGKVSTSRPTSATTTKKSGKDYLHSVLGGTPGELGLTSGQTQEKSDNKAPGSSLNLKGNKPTKSQNISQGKQSVPKEQEEEKAQQAESDSQAQDSTEEGDFVQRAKSELMRITNELKEISIKKQEKMKREEKIHKNEKKPEPTIVASTEPEEVLPRKCFLLEEEGHMLTLPSKYRKMKSLNSKLIYQIHKSLSETDSNNSETFTSRLENQFDWSNQLSHEAVLAETQALMDSQHKLVLHTNWVIDRSRLISVSDSASFSWQNVYKCYRHWQVLLGKFREVQKRTQDLIAAEGYLQRYCPCGGCLAVRELSSHFSSVHQTNQEDLSTSRSCLFSTWLTAEEKQTEPLDHVTYTSDKELRMLNEALHDLQTSELNVYIQRHIGSKALRVLEQLDPSDRYIWQYSLCMESCYATPVFFWMREHKASVRLAECENSALADHANSLSQDVAWDNASILAPQDQWLKRKITDAWMIASDINGLTNGDCGRKLPENYLPLIKKK